MKKYFKQISAGFMLVALFFVLSACGNQSPFELDNNQEHAADLNKGPRQMSDESLGTSEQGSMLSRYYKKWDAYQGGKINLAQGSQFELLYGSLTPPPELHGENVTITMSATEDPLTNEVLFEFGPHGSQFDPPATVYLHYPGTGPQLFYIEEDGSRVEQTPDEVDTMNQWVIIKVNHFSRYALAWSN